MTIDRAAKARSRTTDQALDALRALTRGPKGRRPDYVGALSTLDATLIVAEIAALRGRLDAVREHVAEHLVAKGCCGWHREKLNAILGEVPS